MGAPRLTRANLLATLLTVALGFAIATTIQQNQIAGLGGLRQDELVRLLDDVTQRSNRLDNQVRELEAQRDTLKSGADNAAAAVAQAQRRLDQLAILAGTVPARGPGIRLTITDPDNKLRAAMLLDVLQELRDAGAEVVQFGSVRMVAESSFSDAGSAVVADGQTLPRPFVILAIGDPQTLAKAMDIPGGIVATVRRQGGSATVEQVPALTITAVREARTPTVAKPVAEPTTTPASR
ncbi:MAG TPA: DUF881 domain-containing protein [Microthrixaceae bacterium]|nr:DUF881 domain-containing protein [Microthrixaceae bacterium]